MQGAGDFLKPPEVRAGSRGGESPPPQPPSPRVEMRAVSGFTAEVRVPRSHQTGEVKKLKTMHRTQATWAERKKENPVSGH